MIPRISVFEMSTLMDIIRKIIEKMTRSNPYSLVLKGGTALAYHHLNWHRDSEDLDFDSPKNNKENIENIQKWLAGLFDELVKDGIISEYRITKSSFANTERFHMKILFRTYKDLHTKIDIDFRDINSEFEYDGELAFYSSEHMLISKLNTYMSRGTLKDIYDISCLLRIINYERYSNRTKLALLVEDVIKRLEGEDITKTYAKAFANVDLRFKNLKKKDLPSFKKKTLKDLNIFKNQLLK
jgi:predicted nucleotidyltransferase component of viral defense system